MSLFEKILDGVTEFLRFRNNKATMRKYVITNRLTLDLDGHNNWNETAVKGLVKQIRKELKPTLIEVFKSASGKGWHVYAYFKLPISFNTQFDLRKKYGDCEKRLSYSRQDYENNLNPDVMFTSKKGDDGVWRHEEFLYSIPKRKDVYYPIEKEMI